MKDLLSPANRETLAAFARTNVLVAFDYDGTLSPIVDDPEAAKMRPQTRELLWQVSKLYPVIVITGRAQPDALLRLRGVGLREVIGNHGIEPRHAANRHVDEVQRWRPVLEACVDALDGVTLEDKIFSVAIHYRRSEQPDEARAAILKAAASLGNARVIGGKRVVNIVPADAPHKGNALLRERDRLNCDTAMYVGDDETDEDVFTLGEPQRLLTVRVGAQENSAATYQVSDQTMIDDLLTLLIELRQESDAYPHGSA